MKKISVALTLFLISAACLVALNQSVNQQARALQATQALWQTQTQQLAETHAQVDALAAKTRDQKQELHNLMAASPTEPAAAADLLTNDVRHAPPESQTRWLESFGPGKNSTANYVLVSKAALAKSDVRPLKSFPNNAKLGDAVRGLLAITPDEQLAVESAFTNAYTAIAAWARENVQREGPTGDLLAQYSIPADAAFRGTLMTNLFSDINSAIGVERGDLLRKYFDSYALYEDAAIGDRTNILAIYRSTNSPGYAYRAGWRWANHSEAINTFPEPILPNRFPLAYRFVFPSGWPEVAQREGFDLP